MDQLLRTLIKEEQISLVAMDATQMIRHAQIIHNMTKEATKVFGKILMTATYMSAWLKEKDSQISVNFKHRGDTGEVCVSGDGEMHMRGFIHNPLSENGEIGKGYMTVVRDDHYKSPFVGTCEMVSKEVDENFEYYYRLSEQLPTYIHTDISFDESGLCACAAGVYLQPMPDADDLQKQWAQVALKNLVGLAYLVEREGLKQTLDNLFGVKACKEREIEYHCNCSKEYIAGVLRGMGEAELRDIVNTEGKINVHCHYCNSDYDFFEKDVDEMFSK